MDLEQACWLSHHNLLDRVPLLVRNRHLLVSERCRREGTISSAAEHQVLKQLLLVPTSPSATSDARYGVVQ